MGGSDYDVFISYARSVSTPLAVDLQRELERFAKKWNQMRALRVFRDDSSMSASPSLWSSIEAALTTSNYFILIATPDSAASEYVDQEARWWVTHKGADSILLVLADGKLDWSDAAGGFTPDSVVPPALHRAFAEEPRWIDMTWFDDPDSAGNVDPRFQERVADLAAPVRGVDRDALIGANLKEHRKTMRRARIAIAALATLLVAALVAGGVAVTRGNTAKRLFADAVGQRIAPEAAQILNGEIAGGIGRGLQQMLVAQILKTNPDPGAFVSAMFLIADIEKIVPNGVSAGFASRSSANLIATDSSSGRGDIQIWDTALNPVGLPIKTENGSYPAGLNRDGSLLATGNTAGVIELWDLRTRSRKSSVRVPTTAGPELASITFVAFTPDDKGLVIRTADNTVWFYGTDTLRPTSTAIPNTAWVTAPEDGSVIALAPLHGGAVEIRNPWTGIQIGEPLPVSGRLFFTDCRSFDESGKRLLVDDEIHDLQTRAVTAIDTKPCGGMGLDLNPDGALALQGGSTVTVIDSTVWRDYKGETLSRLSTSKVGTLIAAAGGPFIPRWLDRNHAAIFSPGEMLKLVVDPKRLGLPGEVAFGAAEGDMAVESYSSDESHVFAYHGDEALPAIPGYLFGALGDTFFTGRRGTFDAWDFRNGSRRTLPALLGGDTDVRFMSVDRDNAGGFRSILVHTGRGLDGPGGTLRRLNLTTAQQVDQALPVPEDIVIRDLLYVDGPRVTALAEEANIRNGQASLWSFDLEYRTFKMLKQFDAGEVAAVAMCRDSDRFVTMVAAQTGGVGFANGPPDENMMWAHPLFAGHERLEVGRVAMTSDCRTGASWELKGDLKGALQFWDVDSGSPLGEPIQTGRVIGTTQDGKFAVIAPLDFYGLSGFRIMSPRPTAADLCSKLTSNMSRKQWNEWISPDLEYQKACPELPIAPDE